MFWRLIAPFTPGESDKTAYFKEEKNFVSNYQQFLLTERNCKQLQNTDNMEEQTLINQKIL